MARLWLKYREEQVWKPKPETPMKVAKFNCEQRQTLTAEIAVARVGGWLHMRDCRALWEQHCLALWFAAFGSDKD